MKLKVNFINQPEWDEVEIVVFSKSFKAPKYALWAGLVGFSVYPELHVFLLYEVS